jgi:hypothetical protein
MTLAPAPAALADQITRLQTLTAASDAAGLHAMADDASVDPSIRRVAHLRRQSALARRRGDIDAAIRCDRVADRVMPAQW